jgi:ATP-dependent RNA helicase RhlE
MVKAGIKAEAIHGNKSQNARQTALKNFTAQTTRVLVATDIAARGIDVDDLEYVINFELPNIPETYVHRIGRTGRAGANGTAISFCDIEEKAYLKDIEKVIGKKVPVVEAHRYPMKVLTIEKKAKQGPPNRGGKPAGPGAAKPAENPRSFDKAKAGRKWYGKKNTY